MAVGMKHLSKTFVWILMGMIMFGLVGFGAVSFSGSNTAVATVGDREITVEEYYRAMQREQRALQAQTGQLIPMAQLAALGVDRQVLGRLVSVAAIDNEVGQLGISIGDENLLKEIVEVPSFQGLSGEFDRESYTYALNNAGLSERDFEDDLRREAARTLVQGAMMVGAEMPTTMRDTITSFIGARRSFSWVQLGQDQTAMIALAPTDAELQAYYDANPDQFTLPEAKEITYVLMSPTMLIDQVEIEQQALQDLFNQRAEQYQAPERRLVERLVFSDDAAASSAMAQLETNGATFESLVDNRGLALADVDMGDVTMGALGAAGQEIFSAQVGDVVGPLPTDLGPALFRINGHLGARVTLLADVEAELRDELASGRARRLIEQQAEEIDDLLAGGATLDDIADETDMERGQISWTAQSSDGVAAYNGFREAAAAVTAEDFPAVNFLEDGSLFAIRLDNTLPARPEPLADAMTKALQGWNAEQRQNAITTEAKAILARAEINGEFDDNLTVTSETGLTRTAYIDNTPADMMTQLFEMAPGELRLVSDDSSTVVLRLEEILPADENNDLAALANALQAQLNQALSQALFQAFAQDAQSRARPTIDQQAINAVQANFQ
ncbi:peptidylprolyl isomerase [Parasedimentitalea psychrophila]|uniref:SurA N-terminal domain-containing protein n=1 Tax=Parasedimentitalea psychrophila TaxID=2997337 RepID=A0A9Y2P6P2_9RHOB|nr:peptidylprolyl isomerase [Parasedimentitalea psychrophila]WIY24915.1 SurA N-terminal domain-containing protein [Parasedimentitalea psychrophila]